MAMWSEYFPKGQVVGVDKSLKEYEGFHDELKKAGAFQNDNVSVFQRDLTEKASVQHLLKQFAKHTPFQIILDDALHKAQVQFNNFRSFWPLLVALPFRSKICRTRTRSFTPKN